MVHGKKNNSNKKMRQIFKCLVLSLLICMFQSCVPVLDYFEVIRFKNCTSDSLYIGASLHDNIDSVFDFLDSCCPLSENYAENVDTLWNVRVFVEDFVCPDSLGSLYRDNKINHADTCYFFLVKYSDSRYYSWDEIRTKKLYGKCIVTRNADGELDRNIRYMK